MEANAEIHIIILTQSSGNPVEERKEGLYEQSGQVITRKPKETTNHCSEKLTDLGLTAMEYAWD